MLNLDIFAWTLKGMEMNKNVFIINGSGGSGKDTFIFLVESELLKYDKETMTYSSAETAKQIVDILNFTKEKDEKYRKCVSDIKAAITKFSDVPFLQMMSKYVEFMAEENAVVLFLHIREPQEIERAVGAFNAKTILVKNDNVEQIKSNDSDANVFDYDYDIVIDNSGSKNELRIKAEQFVKSIME